MRLPSLEPAEFAALRAVLHRRFGLSLAEHKRTMVEAQLWDLMRKVDATDTSTFARSLPDDTRALAVLVDAVTVNYTEFYRHPDQMARFSAATLPECTARLSAKGVRDLRVWCAAASTGEEPWTLAMLLREHFEGSVDAWQAGLVATDLCARALATAGAGRYPVGDTASLPEPLRDKWLRDCGNGQVEVRQELRADVLFRRLNLTQPQWPFRRPFHVIFCRNVLIYFDAATRRAVIRRLFQALEPGGWLFLGLAESVADSDDAWQRVAPSTYRRR